MKQSSILMKFGVVATAALVLSSCTKDPNSPGYEYMPDMYRSASVEAYVDYTNPETQSARLAPANTIPFSADPSKAWVNFPYPFPEIAIDEYRDMAKNLKNPVVYSEDVYNNSATVYVKMCAHCHGEKGDGKGQIALNGKIEGIPGFADRKGLTDGQIFHSISYGKGAMGAHAPLLSKEERWGLVHWIRKTIDDSYTGSTAITPDSNATAAEPTPAAQPE